MNLMSSDLGYWLEQLKKRPIENSMAIFDITFEYPKNLKVYSKEDGLVLIWQRSKIPYIMLIGDDDIVLGILKKEILPEHKQIFFVLLNESFKNMVIKNLEVEKVTKLDLYYLDKNNFKPFNEIQAIRLNKNFSDGIRNQLELSKELKDQTFFSERLEKGIFYGIIIDDRLVSFIGSIAELESTITMGMFFTNPDFRRQHYGLSCASHLTKTILESNRMPLCYVEVDNEPSIRIWERLGYSKRPENYYFIGVKSR